MHKLHHSCPGDIYALRNTKPCIVFEGLCVGIGVSFQDPIMRDLGACDQQIFNKVCWRSWLYQGIGLDVVRSSKANLYNVQPIG